MSWPLARPLLLLLPCALLLLLEHALPQAAAPRLHASWRDPRTPPAARPWHPLTPPTAAAWQERLEREEAGLRAAYGGLAGVAPPRAGTFEATRPYLVWMLEDWVALHGVQAGVGGAMGTHAPDPEWAVLPHDQPSTLFCIYGGAGPVHGRDIANASFAFAGRYGLRDACDLHTMALPAALGAMGLFVWHQTLEHLMDPELAMARIAAHLRPGGWHVLTAPAHNIPHAEPFHFFMFTPAGLAALAAASGTPAVELGYYGSPAFNAITHTMAFVRGGRVPVPGNQLTERFWPGELPGEVPIELKGAAQVAMLARRSTKVGEGSMSSSSRPRLLEAEEVWALWESWVRGKWGWLPSKAALQATARALAGAAAPPVCATLQRVLGVGEYLALVGLYEALASAPALPPLGMPWLVSTMGVEVGQCFCHVAAAAVRSNALTTAAAAAAGTPPCTQWSPAAKGAGLVLAVDTLEHTADATAHVAALRGSVGAQGYLWLGARAVAPRDPYANSRLMLRSVTPTALVVTAARMGLCMVHAGHWGGRDALSRWVSAEDGREASMEGLGLVEGGGKEVEAGEWVSALHGWALAVDSGAQCSKSGS